MTLSYANITKSVKRPEGESPQKKILTNNSSDGESGWNIISKRNVASTDLITSTHSHASQGRPRGIFKNNASRQNKVATDKIDPNSSHNTKSLKQQLKKNQRNTQRNPAQKNSKSKPKSNNISIGDVKSGSNNKIGKKTPCQEHRKTNLNLNMNSAQHFPSLASDAIASNKIATEAITAGSKPVWGSLPKTPPTTPSSSFLNVKPKANSFHKAKPPSSRSSPSSMHKKQKNAVFSTGTIPKLLKRGETLPKAKNSTKKKKSQNKTKSSAHASSSSFPKGLGDAITSSASSFFQPKLRSVDGDTNSRAVLGLEGEEHELLRLMQERTVYQKKGRQRFAPRKKRFTALKKKVLQERLDQWRKLHPVESATETCKNKQISPTTCSLCLYNYTTPEELEDDDEYEEILENLKSMSLKIGAVDELYIPREKLTDGNRIEVEDKSDRKSYHPVLVKFQKSSDAAAALACWNGLIVGGNILEAVSLDIGNDDILSWSERALLAETKQRNVSLSSVDEELMKPIEIILQKVLTDDDYSDIDCMTESLDDLKKIAEKFGELRRIDADSAMNGDVVLTYVNNLSQARNIAESICRIVIGGQPLYASVREQPVTVDLSNESLITIILENILTEDDFDDNDCLNETLNDIKELCLQYGSVSAVTVKGSAVKVTFAEDKSVIKNATSQLNGTIVGGNIIKASMIEVYLDSTTKDDLDGCVDLLNILTKDDLDDDDCMEESIRDVRELASKYGKVESIVLSGTNHSCLRIKFGGGNATALKAVEGFRGLVIGGQILNAVFPGKDDVELIGSKSEVLENCGDKRKSDSDTKSTITFDKKSRTDDKSPLYSGDKLISERFAEMKRVPKIPNTSGPRIYASITHDERVRPLLAEMLGELMRLQKRAVEDKNTKAKRRLVMGLREVARGIRSHKVKMVIMANNLDQYGVIDEKLQEIIDLTRSECVPLFFEFTKRSLGKAIGKSIKIAVIGIQNADGAHQQFKKLNLIAPRI